MGDLTNQAERVRYEALRTQLALERASFEPQWRDALDLTSPTRARFCLGEGNRGDRRNQKILDSHGSMASRTLSAGLMSGVTSPARPWFKLTTSDPDLAEFSRVKNWLSAVSDRMRTLMLKSNLYNTLPAVYKDLGDVGTAPFIVEEDFRTVFRTQSFAPGSYYIAKDYRGKVNVFFREFRMTVRNLVHMFAVDRITNKIDWKNVSPMVKNLWDQQQYEQWVDVCHIIEPNELYNPALADRNNKFKKFKSVYYERGTTSATKNYSSSVDPNVMLRRGGYDYFPVLCPRWSVTNEDAYATDCPGFTALGDLRQLMWSQKRKAEAIEKKVRPPMVAPTKMKTQRVSILPSDITYVDTDGGSLPSFRPAFNVVFDIRELADDITQVKQAISRAYYEDLFFAITELDRRQVTAREIDERREEKLLALGPVYEQLNQDQNDDLIDIVYALMEKQGEFEGALKPPEELEGQDLKVEYVSIMAQAQKLIGVSSIERFSGFVANVAAYDPSVLDKINNDELVEVYGDALSINPKIIRSQDDVDQMRQHRAEAQQQAQKAEQAQQSAMAVKNLAQAPIEKDNALGQILDFAQAGQGAQVA